MKTKTIYLFAITVIFLLSTSPFTAYAAGNINSELLEMVKSGNIEAVKSLLEKGADVNAIDKAGWTALMFAARYGQGDIAEELIRKNARINVKDKDGWTPLMLAAMYGHRNVIHVLLTKGADIHARNKDGWTALKLAKQAKDSADIVQALQGRKDALKTEWRRNLPDLAPAERIVKIPAKYEWVEEQVVVREASEGIRVIPAQEEWMEERVVIKPASEGRPAEYRTVRKKIIVAPARTETVVRPPEYKTVRKKVMVEPARTEQAAMMAHPRRKKVMAEGIPSFPWYPPKPTALTEIPTELLLRADGRKTTLKDVSKKLKAAFDAEGYSEKQYYQVPKGFALVSRLEQFFPDGTSKEEPDRWAADFRPPKVFSLASYIKAIFTAKPSRYRIVAFIVTSEHFKRQGRVNREEAMAWLDKGMVVLPKSIGEQPYTDEHYCTALIYEFELPENGKKALFKTSSNLTGKDHLQKSNLWTALQQ
ncbi:MAG: ankyrin repeat domain-containing protein [Candidatus Electrothrix gigas]